MMRLRARLAFCALLSLFFLFVLSFGAQAVTECWGISSQASCTGNASNGCAWDSTNSFCKKSSCYDGDQTNQTYCMVNLNNTYNLKLKWEIYGSSLCDPEAGNFSGNGCEDYDGDQTACLNTFYCIWSPTSQLCDPPFGFDDDDYTPVMNPSCSIIQTQGLCTNITGCSWGGSCSGNTDGLKCSNLHNKTLCGDATFLSTCCNWNGTACKTSMEMSCYDTVADLAGGKTFCEDYLAFNNKTICEEIAGTPWFMPCKWDNTSNECHFNGAAFGDVSGYDEIGTKAGCDAQGGLWKSETWQNTTNSLFTDSWCEFKFGFEFSDTGNCDSACWACETTVSAAKGNSTAQAQTLCENSALGYCDFHTDTFAQNGLGWCNPKMEFVQGGGKSCNDECSSCDYMLNPQAQCQNSTSSCIWFADTSAPNGVGNCYGKNEKRCENDCWSCIDSPSCAGTGDGGGGACVWDNSNLYCKPSGFTGEVCFDGKDNDADGKLDCLDSDCSTDKFCGGGDLDVGFGQDCPSLTSNASCLEKGCVWLVDDFDTYLNNVSNKSLVGFCDFPGAQCWQNDDNSSACNATSGCAWLVSDTGFCEENITLFGSCFPKSTQVDCEAVGGCDWSQDPYSGKGRCEPLIFSQCFGNSTRQTNQTNCQMNETYNGLSTQICNWLADPYIPSGGFCEAVCWTTSGAECQAKSNGLCERRAGICDPVASGGNCYNADGNETRCKKTMNATCSWFADTLASNNVSNGTPGVGVTPSGWCDPKGAGQFVSFMGVGEPVVIGTDDIDGVNDSFDISGVGLRDEFDKLVLGTRVVDGFANSSTCNNVPTYNTNALGAGQLNYTFLWYLDADGNHTNNCATRDNSSLNGFEFLFKYQSWWTTAQGDFLVAYRCSNTSWGATPIPLISSEQIMCDLVGGGMAGIDKKELFKYKALYNKSADLRIYATVTNRTNNDSHVIDVAGPFYYTQGAVDSRFEDCSDSSGDADGDGLKATNDPDCQMFLKFGFMPNEMGFLCGDGQDNDGDGDTDCNDAGCKYDFMCGGGGVPIADTNDKTSPKLVWFEVETFPDSAFIMFDTNEPANGTVRFYHNDSACKILNKTVRDNGILDNFIASYKVWHDVPIDNSQFNMERIDSSLKNKTTFFYKTEVCDINGNCASSACLNFTTKTVLADCKGCKTTLNFPFTAKSGSGTSDPMGDIQFTIKTQAGTETVLAGNAAAGMQLNYTDAKNFDLKITNPNATNVSKWQITLLNASIAGKISTGVLNFSGGSDVLFNATVNGSYVGLDSTKCMELINAFRPKKLEIGIPGNHSIELWQCDEALSNCTNKASNATFIAFNVSLNLSFWRVPADWGC